MAAANRDLSQRLSGKTSLNNVPPDQRSLVRTDLYLLDRALTKLTTSGQVKDTNDRQQFSTYRAQLDRVSKDLPFWVKVAVALALGLGTTVGWKRIVRTIRERIGKSI